MPDFNMPPGVSARDIPGQGPPDAEAVTFDRGETFRAVVRGHLQRPTFNARGPALIFARQVAAGLRKPEPVQ